jgi:hypothetical protein
MAETDSVSETPCFLETLDDGQIPNKRFFQIDLSLFVCKFTDKKLRFNNLEQF